MFFGGLRIDEKKNDNFNFNNNTKAIYLLNYSYRNASIGSSFDALTAGYNPETMATAKLVTKAEIIAPQGITKTKSIAEAMPKPIRIPKIIPTKPPI